MSLSNKNRRMLQYYIYTNHIMPAQMEEWRSTPEQDIIDLVDGWFSDVMANENITMKQYNEMKALTEIGD